MPTWKKGQMFIGRELDLDLAASLVLDGMSVDVVGARGSGRSSFLRALEIRLQELGRAIIHIRGVAALRTQPFAALSVAGYADAIGTRGPAALGEAATAVVAAAGERPAVIIVDDWDDLDDVSWGVVDAVRSTNGFPVVISRLRGLSARHSPTGTGGSSLAPTYVIELTPLAFEPMQRVVHERLGGTSDIKTTARIYSKSGGIVGLALNIVDIAVKERRMVRRDGGIWVAVRELWSPALRSVIEGHMEALSAEARDAVHLLALVGVADIDTARTLIDWDTVEFLEEVGLVQFTTNEDQQFLTLTPPLIVDYIRHEPRTARHLRLTDRIVERVGADNPLAVAAAHAGSRALGAAPNNAVFSRMLQERIRSHRLLTETRWIASPEPAEAVDHIRFLLQSAASHTAIQHVFDNTDMTTGDERSLTNLRVMHARWVAYGRGDMESALAMLVPAADDSSERACIFLAASALIRASMSDIPNALVTDLQRADPHTPFARAAVLEAQLYIAVIRGEFTDADRIFEQIATLDPDHRRHVSRALHAYSLTGQGKVAEALTLTRAGMEAAHGRLDLDALRVYGSAAVLAYAFVGDFDAVDRILDTLLATGDSYTLPRGYSIAVLNIAAVVAFRRGDIALGERYSSEISQLSSPDGPLPGQDSLWSAAQLLGSTGYPELAADTLWDSSERLWARGARYSAALGYIASLEFDPKSARFEQARPRIAMVEGGFVRAAESYISALIDGDPDRMHAAARDLKASGRIAYAIAAFRAARRLYDASDRPRDALAAHSDEEALLTSLGGRIYDTARSFAAATSLSERERQVARFAADGLSNAEIATALVLSVRTVESHMHRILRKLGFDGRAELAAIRALL